MDRITRAAKAAYNFFSGDAIILTAVIVDFIVVGLLVNAAHAPNVLSAVIFIAFIVGGLATTLAREVAGRPRHR